MYIMKIIIIGAGWYGLHSYIFLRSNLKDGDIKILEKDTIFFNNSSNFNQNRLHLGYHYPRSYKTRKLCLNGYKKFINEYREVIDFIDFNYYLIANNSFIDYDTYMSIFSGNYYHHNIIKNNTFTNIDGNIINTKEKIINSNKVKKLLKKKINKNDLTLGFEVKKISRKDNKIVINDDLECDVLIDCTYNQLNLSKKKIYI
jgi:L-2-hydroxyglutarate oxidase LhgO